MEEAEELLKEWKDEEVDIEKLSSSLKFSKTWINILLVVVLVVSTGFVFYREQLALTAVKDLGSSPFQLIMLASLVLVIVINIPWQMLGIIPSKIGPLEFTQFLGEQKQEQAQQLVSLREDLALLQERLAQLEQPKALDGSHTGVKGRAKSLMAESDMPTYGESERHPVVQPVRRETLKPDLETWLRGHSNWYFNAPRIKTLSALEGNDSPVASASSKEIGDALEALVAEGKAKVKLSRKGSTLYKLK